MNSMYVNDVSVYGRVGRWERVLLSFNLTFILICVLSLLFVMLPHFCLCCLTWKYFSCLTIQTKEWNRVRGSQLYSLAPCYMYVPESMSNQESTFPSIWSLLRFKPYVLYHVYHYESFLKKKQCMPFYYHKENTMFDLWFNIFFCKKGTILLLFQT